MRICLLGASGSIGTQTIDVVLKNYDDFDIVAFSVGERTKTISSVLRKFPNIKAICVKKKEDYLKFQKKYPNIKFHYGDEGLLDIVRKTDYDMMVNALVGFVGLKPTLAALECNKVVCLANKESLVVGGELIKDTLSRGQGKLYPIDSEHVALAKCLAVDSSNVNKLLLTASGGAFRKLTRDQLLNVKAGDALNHPTWSMGKKITIDCATMVNKAFEVIEAHYLFNYDAKHIGIVLHDESYIHSMVSYKNGLYRMDEGKPDMRGPIKYALYRGVTDYQTVLVEDYKNYKNYHFHEFDIERYPIVKWAEVVLTKKGTYGAVLNAANEVAVHAFLDGKISFLDIERIVEKLMTNHRNIKHPTLEEIEGVDYLTRLQAKKLVLEGIK